MRIRLTSKRQNLCAEVLVDRVKRPGGELTHLKVYYRFAVSHVQLLIEIDDVIIRGPASILLAQPSVFIKASRITAG
jgi:hypothetical protein